MRIEGKQVAATTTNEWENKKSNQIKKAYIKIDERTYTWHVYAPRRTRLAAARYELIIYLYICMNKLSWIMWYDMYGAVRLSV